MPVTINGSTGIVGPDGSAGTPAVQGTDTNTGVFFPAADTIAWTTGGTERMRVDSSGNVGIGTSSPSGSANYKSLTISGTSGAEIFLNAGATNYGYVYVDSGGFRIINSQSGAASGTLQFYTANTERARITSGGRLNIGTAGGSATRLEIEGGETQCVFINTSATDANYKTTMAFTDSGGTTRGTIRVNNSATQYNTSSDYRLKENIQPMTGALAKVQALKPCTFNWKIDGAAGEGFIAHELAEVAPDAVAGEKDAVETYTDKDGNEQARPVYQGIDTSFLVATLTAAIQELKAELDTAKARIAALEAA